MGLNSMTSRKKLIAYEARHIKVGYKNRMVILNSITRNKHNRTLIFSAIELAIQIYFLQYTSR